MHESELAYALTSEMREAIESEAPDTAERLGQLEPDWLPVSYQHRDEDDDWMFWILERGRPATMPCEPGRASSLVLAAVDAVTKFDAATGHDPDAEPGT